MKRFWRGIRIFPWIIFFIIIFHSLLFMTASAGNAGVGVLNVPPNYADIKILQQDNTIRVYLIISDYNSWMDIQKVQINLEDDTNILHSFIYEQYEDPEKFSTINRFTDNSIYSLLLEDLCDVTHSEQSQTVEDRCHLTIRFVFKKTYFTHIHVIASDRIGDSSEAYIEYNGEGDINRESNTVSIPWIDGVIRVELPYLLLDIMLLIIAVFSTFLLGRKIPFSQVLQQVFYETK